RSSRVFAREAPVTAIEIPEPLIGAHPALCTAILNGKALTRGQQEAIFTFLTGEALVRWSERADYSDNQQAHDRAQAEQDDRVRECAATFLAMIAKILSLPEDVVRFEA